MKEAVTAAFQHSGVGAHVEEDRQAPFRANAGQRGVKRHLAYGDAHAA
jgi:hypothetical protein